MMIWLVLITMLCCVLGLLRFIWGPSDADRVIAVDILFSAALILCIFAALMTQRVLFLDIAVGISVIGFVATLAWSRLVERRSARREDRS